MVNTLWLALVTLGIVYGILAGNVSQVTAAIFGSAELAVQIILGMVGVMGFWLGLAKVAESSGLLEIAIKIFRPLVCWIFPSVPSRHPALGSILLNLTANFLGLGNAATPFGLRAMRQLQSLNPRSDEATDAMCTFLAINTSGLTLIPTMVIAVRAAQGSQSPTEIIGVTLLTTLTATTVALLVDWLFRSNGRSY